MGKIKKNKNKIFHRHNPLEQQILDNKYAQSSSRNKIRSKQPNDDEFVDNKLANKILKQARKQQEDLEEECGISNSKLAFKPSINLSQNDLQESDDDEDGISMSNFAEGLEEIKISEEDEKAFQNFMGGDSEKRATLADIIKEKLTEKQTEIFTVYSDAGTMLNEDIEKKMPIYKDLAPILKEYRSGKLPKAFKVIPQFRQWEQILNLTQPDQWSAAAMYQATRIFSSNLKDKMAQRFYNLILLPRLRDDIAESKVLNFHLYQALKKALFKPAAFFKGIILPLLEARNCTLREASIFGSVLAKFSVPLLHSSAALLKIAEMPFSGASSIFMRVLLEKKYALPFRVVNGVVDHFLGFMDSKQEYPLLWHQCLLTFVQIYKNDLSGDQRENILKLTTVHHHAHISPEIRKEFQDSKNQEESFSDVQDSTIC